jgi:hypothetical protein
VHSEGSDESGHADQLQRGFAGLPKDDYSDDCDHRRHQDADVCLANVVHVQSFDRQLISIRTIANDSIEERQGRSAPTTDVTAEKRLALDLSQGPALQKPADCPGNAAKHDPGADGGCNSLRQGCERSDLHGHRKKPGKPQFTRGATNAPEL